MYFSKKVKLFFAAVSVTIMLALPGSAFAASYTVRAGDTLYLIGKQFNTTASTIMQNNSLTSSMIYPGQVLDIPAATYTVKSGDTLYLIAKRHNVGLYSLREANNKWDNNIYPGQKLIIPGHVSNEGQVGGESSSGTESGSRIPYTSSDLDLLARLIMAETDGQPYNAMVGVGGVVINRVKSSEFPSSISSVIYQKSGGYYQFTPVKNGWINKPASQEARKAAYDALHGSDPSNGALFYFDDSSTNKWLWSKPLAARIGRMVFVY